MSVTGSAEIPNSARSLSTRRGRACSELIFVLLSLFTLVYIESTKHFSMAFPSLEPEHAFAAVAEPLLNTSAGTARAACVTVL